jgi:hypothetical protein
MFGGGREETTAITDPVFAFGQCDGNLRQSELPGFGDCAAGSYSN